MKTMHCTAPSRLPAQLRGVVLPEISRPSDLADHTGLPEALFVGELEAGRLPGIKVVDQWLVHRRAVQAWLGALDLNEQEVTHAS